VRIAIRRGRALVSSGVSLSPLPSMGDEERRACPSFESNERDE
jgi:hypothetical protein